MVSGVSPTKFPEHRGREEWTCSTPVSRPGPSHGRRARVLQSRFSLTCARSTCPAWPCHFSPRRRHLLGPHLLTWLHSGPWNQSGLSAYMKSAPGLWGSKLVFCLRVPPLHISLWPSVGDPCEERMKQVSPSSCGRRLKCGNVTGLHPECWSIGGLLCGVRRS